MAVPVMVNAYWAIANVIRALVVTNAVTVYVRYCVRNMVNILMASVFVIPVGRVKNALYVMMNAKLPIVTVTVIVLVANANVCVVIKANSVKKVVFQRISYRIVSYHIVSK